MTKKYVLTIYIDSDKGTSYVEAAGELKSAELRNIVAVLMQIQVGMVMQLNYQSQPMKTDEKETKAD